jgi:Ser/Thr protein kinase RdoA (MazF antagonist)
MSREYSSEAMHDLERMVGAALAKWNLPENTDVTLLNISENATYLLRTSGAADLILRVHRVDYCSSREIRSELAWLVALREEGVIETARPVPGRDGELVQELASPSGRAARYAVAFERLPGTEPPSDDGAAPWFLRLGELTAKMHRHAKSWQRPTFFERKRWDLDGMIGPRGYWGPWREAIGLDSPGASVLESALGRIRARLARYGSAAERFGLVHADLRLANLLIDDTQLRIIDFDDCGFSWFMYDFATGVSFIEDDPQVPALLEAWISGYSKVARLADEDLAEIPTLVMLRRVLLCAWLASHREVPLAMQLGAAYTEGTVALAEAFLGGRFLTGSA